MEKEEAKLMEAQDEELDLWRPGEDGLGRRGYVWSSLLNLFVQGDEEWRG